MSQPAKIDIELFIGQTWVYPFEWLKREGTENVRVDLSEYTAKMPIVPIGKKEPWMTLKNVVGNGSGIRLHGTSGIVEPVIEDKDTLTITWKRATYALYLIKTETERDNSEPLLTGEIIIATGLPPGALKEI